MKSKLLLIVIFIFTFGGIFIADELGFWQTESTKQPSLIREGEFEGSPDPKDIRGSYTFLDIENAFGVESVIIAKAFNISADDPDNVQVKKIEEIYGDLPGDVEIGTGSVKIFVFIYTGLPYDSLEYLPSTAVTVLKEEGKWNDTLEKEFADYILWVDEVSAKGPQATEGKVEETEIEKTEVTGKTTAKDTIDLGLTLEEIEDIMGIKIENENLLIRDLCTQNNLDFTDIKAALKAKLMEK